MQKNYPCIQHIDPSAAIKKTTTDEKKQFPSPAMQCFFIPHPSKTESSLSLALSSTSGKSGLFETKILAIHDINGINL
jgi:hypothetical protein